MFTLPVLKYSDIQIFVSTLSKVVSGTDSRALGTGPKGPGSRLTWQNTAMYINGNWRM